jgi:hypothetical protein
MLTAEQGKIEPWDELRRYLKGPLAQGVANIVGYWGVCRFYPLKSNARNFAGQHQTLEYPTLSWMACDYLAIQGSATPSERAFSGGGITGTANRNCLSVATFEALQILKSVYHNRHITAADDAGKHLDLFSDSLETRYPSVEV